MELRSHQVRANTICPEPINAARMDSMIAREAEQKGVSEEVISNGYAPGIPIGTFLEAHEIAHMALFLTSERAQYVSGQAISVDGNTFNPDPQV